MDSQKSLQKPLRDVSKQLSKVQEAQIEFLSEAVLPTAIVAQCKGNLWEIYKCLCNSREHKKNSLHIMLYLLESADCPAIDELSTKVKSPVTCVIPRLAVRKLLVDVANELNESAEDFIGYAAEDLKINPQKFQTQDAGHREGLLELFKCALKQCLITDDNLLNLKEWLHKVDAEAILIDIIKGFDPSIPLCLPQQSPTEDECAPNPRIRSLSGSQGVYPGTPPQGEDGSLMKHGLSQLSNSPPQVLREDMSMAPSQTSQVHKAPTTSMDFTVDVPSINRQQFGPSASSHYPPQAVQHGFTVPPTHQETHQQTHHLAQASGSTSLHSNLPDLQGMSHTESQECFSGSEGKQSFIDKQPSIEEEGGGKAKLVYTRTVSSPSESSEQFRDSLQLAYENLPQTLGNHISGMQLKHLIPALYKKASSNNQSSDDLQSIFSSDTHKKVLIVCKDEVVGSVVMIHAVQQWLERKLLSDTPLVLYVPMQQLAGKGNVGLEDILGIYSESFQKKETVRELIAQDSGKGVVFLIDGLKESSVSAMADILQGMKFPNAAVYITCQPSTAAWLEFPTTTVVEVGNLSEENVCNFLYAHFHSDTAKAEELMKYRELLPAAKDLTILPLHLATLASVVGNASLPKTETELVNLIMLYALRFACSRRVSPIPGSFDLHDFDQLPAKEKQVFHTVCKLAFESLQGRKQCFTTQDLGNCSIDCGVSYLFPSLLTTSQQLTEKGLSTTVYKFIHPAIQDFLAALHLCCQISPEQQCHYIREHGKKLFLSNMFKFYCGIMGGKAMDNLLTAFKLIVHNEYHRNSCKISMLPFRCAFEAESVEVCTSLVHSILQSLEIQSSNEMLTPLDCSAIGYVVSKTHVPLKNLDLTACRLQSSCVKSLVQMLYQPLHDVTKFGLSGAGNSEDCETLPHLRSLLQKLPSLKELSLCSFNLQLEDQMGLLSCISNCDELQTLSLSRCSLTTYTGQKCRETLQSLKRLRELDLSYNTIEDKALEDLLPGLEDVHLLQKLSLRECGLTSGKLVARIHQLPGLRSLNLQGNLLCDKGIIEMVTEVMGQGHPNICLECMNIADNRITQTGGFMLVSYVQQNTNLKTLNLGFNDIPENCIAILKQQRLGLNVASVDHVH